MKANRLLELQLEYTERFGVEKEKLLDHFEEIVFDLIEKVKAGERLEDGNGAAFWGGYFYLQTVAAVLGQAIPAGLVRKMVADKKIDLDGMVVQPYLEAPSPSWQESFRLEDDGWIGIASLPMHRKMHQAWELIVLDTGGAEVDKDYLALSHSPDFGPDVEDVVDAEEKLLSLISSAKTRG
jgi:hypothetical protein